jgi:hypothetical protein
MKSVKPFKSAVHARFLALLLCFPHSAAWGQGTVCPPGCGPGRWASGAIDLSTVRSNAPEETRNILVPSPDHQKTVHILKDKWWVETGEAKISPTRNASSVFYPAEIAWASNSDAFYITESMGYSTGYHALVYRLEKGELR